MNEISVHHITPGRSDKDYGRAINDLIEFLPDDDWICLRDIDTMPLHHRVFFKQCEDIANSGEWDLVSCKTNRIGVAHQLHGNQKSNDFNIKNHVEIAHQRYEQYGSQVIRSCGLVAGLMMLFPKRIWLEVGGFPEGGIAIEGKFIDYLFSESILKIGGRIGIARGIYLWHTYRDWADNTRSRMAQEHLH